MTKVKKNKVYLLKYNKKRRIRDMTDYPNFLSGNNFIRTFNNKTIKIKDLCGGEEMIHYDIRGFTKRILCKPEIIHHNVEIFKLELSNDLVVYAGLKQPFMLATSSHSKFYYKTMEELQPGDLLKVYDYLTPEKKKDFYKKYLNIDLYRDYKDHVTLKSIINTAVHVVMNGDSIETANDWNIAVYGKKNLKFSKRFRIETVLDYFGTWDNFLEFFNYFNYSVIKKSFSHYEDIYSLTTYGGNTIILTSGAENYRGCVCGCGINTLS